MLHFYWQAVLKSGIVIKQFSELSESEVSFGEIQEHDNVMNLKSFQLVCAEDGLIHLSVDLETGKLQIREGSFHPYNALSRHNDTIHYRLVFYRRMRRHLGTNMEPLGDPFIYRFLIGWQCTYNGLNYQRIIFYDPESGGIEIQAKR